MTDERDRINVVFIQRASSTFGGGTKMLWRLLRYLDKERFDVTVISQLEDDLTRRLAKEDVTVDIVPYRGLLDVYNSQILSYPLHKKAGTVLRILQYNWECRHHLRRADVVWVENIRVLLTLAPYCVLSRTPIIWNIGLGRESEGTWKWLNELGLRLADRVFIESDHQARSIFTEEQYERHVDDFEVFHKGIDTEHFSPSEDVNGNDQLRVGTAAIITPRKGLEDFVDAAELVVDDHPNVEFVVAGKPGDESDKAYRDELVERVEDAGLADQFEFLGWVDDMPSFYESLDVFVLSSYNEGIPGSVREAMAMELPVVATDVGGTAEVVLDEETGALVSPEDPEQIAAAVRRFVSDSGLRQQVGSQGREQIYKHFSRERYVSQYEIFLQELTK